MAFGIDDVLMAAASAISLGDTLVKVVKANSQKPGQIYALLAEVRVEAAKRLKDAQEALNQFERTLVEREINLDSRLADVVRRTPFFRPFEAYRLHCAKKALDQMGDCLFRSADDILALLRCSGDVGDAGQAIAQSAEVKNEFHRQFTHAGSVREQIDLVRARLDAHLLALQS
jgi:hypothetical protein